MVRSKAFTLMEILVVLVIVGFLMGLIGPRLFKQIAKSDTAKTKIKMAQVKNGLIEYKQDMGHFPNKREGGIQALFYKPNANGSEKWDGPYINSEEDLYDSDGNSFELNIPPVSKKFRFFELISPSMDGDESKEIIIGA